MDFNNSFQYFLAIYNLGSEKLLNIFESKILGKICEPEVIGCRYWKLTNMKRNENFANSGPEKEFKRAEHK